MKRFVIFAAAAMLAMSGPVFAKDKGDHNDDGHPDCGQGGCQTVPGTPGGHGGNGGNGGNANAGAIGVGVGIGVGIANAESSANASASAGAIATNETNVSNTNLNANTNTQGQQQGQLQGQVAFGGTSSSVSQGGSINISGGGEGSEGGAAPFSSNLTVAEGAVQNSNTNTATGGNVAAGAVVNNVTVQTPEGNNGVQVESGGSLGNAQASGNETQVAVDARTFNESKTVIPAASAAPSFATICSSGAAGQSTTYGFSFATTAATCRHLMAADALMAIGDKEGALKQVRKAVSHANVKGFVSYVTTVLTLGIIE